MRDKGETAWFTPDWARDVVWYQIFPERFRNGAPQSNPRLEDCTDRAVPGWAVCEWGRDWYRPTPWEEAGSLKHGIFERRYGGDLVGVREKLDYLQELGVTGLYLNPVFKAQSLHKYDGASFHHIDPTFGPDRDGDLRRLAEAEETEDPATWIWTAADRYFLELVREVHDRGMRVILDGVFNHTGRDFFAFQDLLRHGRDSRYADWFLIDRWNKDGSFEYAGWFNHKQLPEFNRTKHNLVAPVRQYIFDATQRWMDPDQDGDRRKGVDGWRLDVAFCVPHGFWRDWRSWVKSLNPEAYLTAEIIAMAKEYLRGDEFDAVMNYMWMYPVASYFAPAKHPMSTTQFKRRLDRVRRAYPPAATAVLQNLLDSHDVGRFVSMMENAELKAVEWEAYFHRARVKDNPSFITTRPGPAAWAALQQATIFQMCYPGAPMIYYGNEVGLWGANDPDNRQPMLWDDVAYEDETHTFAGTVPAQPRQPDRALFAFFRRAIAMRQRHAALRRGSFHWLRSGRQRVIGFERVYDGETVRVWLSTRDEPVHVRQEGAAVDLWADDAPVQSGWLEIPARGWRVVRV
jgi:cyclomaltodextrinase / maltogenic alpha-amylase / neopullulanase